MIWLKLVIFYFFIGTIFLILFMLCYLHLDMVNRKTGEKLENVDTWILSFCLYWPFLLVLLFFSIGKDDDDFEK